MCKKLGLAALVIVAGIIVLNKLDLLGYAKLGIQRAKERARDQISPELKIERLKQDIVQLAPDMDKHRSAMAAEMVAIDKLKREIQVTENNLERRKKEIVTMRTLLKEHTEFVTLNGDRYPREKVESRLARDWESFKQAEAALKSQRDLLRAREDNLSLAEQKLAELKSKKEQLEIRVAQLETELRNLRLAQQRSNFKIDDSAFSNIQRQFEEIEERLAREKKELELKQAEFSNNLEIPVRQHVQTQEALKEIEERFGGSKVAAEPKK
jgi:chromosome segregation ATPase